MTIKCLRDNCPRAAVMAIRTHPEPLRSLVFYDVEMAPAKADRCCRTHGLELMNDLIRTLVLDDITTAEENCP